MLFSSFYSLISQSNEVQSIFFFMAKQWFCIIKIHAIQYYMRKWLTIPDNSCATLARVVKVVKTRHSLLTYICANNFRNRSPPLLRFRPRYAQLQKTRKTAWYFHIKEALHISDIYKVPWVFCCISILVSLTEYQNEEAQQEIITSLLKCL